MALTTLKDQQVTWMRKRKTYETFTTKHANVLNRFHVFHWLSARKRCMIELKSVNH